jgi:sulfite reductase (ferredoxin)
MTIALFDLPARIRRAEALLPSQAAAFMAGTTSGEAFRAQRVPQGLYEQRSADSYMLRVRLPGGLVTADQLAGLATLATVNACPRIHLTTRQDVQFHDLGLSDAVTIQKGLSALGLSARGTGGNTVRNVTADPLAGVAQDEAFDVRPWALATTSLLLDRDGTDALPRKFKVVFSGSAADRAGAAVADLGFIAHLRDGQPGFIVVAGGGLGGRPALALPILDWVPAHEAPLIAGAVVDLFAAHGNRDNKAIARLRHVRHRLGADAFTALVREWIERARTAGAATPAPAILPPLADLPAGPLPAHWQNVAGIVPERRAQRVSVRLAPPLGDLSADDLAAIADAARRFADPVLRAGLDQELWLTGVAGDQLDALLAALAGRTLGQPGSAHPHIPACAGADTCKLGLLRSRACATAVAARLEQDHLTITGLRISGCPNSCGRHLVAGIGLEGKVKRVNNRLLPCFEVYAGGSHGLLGAGASLGTRLGTVPAKRIPDLIAAVAKGGDLRALIASHGAIPAQVPEDWFSDWGDSVPFSLAGLGEGECAAG